MKLKLGDKLASTVCGSRFVVVAAPDQDLDLRCGGGSLVSLRDGEPLVSGAPAAGHAAGSLVGKRYADPELGLELICTQGGAGSLSVDDREVPMRAPKLLPSSD